MSRLLISAAKSVSVNSEKIGLGVVWLFTTATTLIKNYIWDDPEAIWFLFMAYHIALFFELYWLHTQERLTWKTIWKKCKKVTGMLFGALVLLYIATGSAKYSHYAFAWLPMIVMDFLIGAVAWDIIDYASRIGIIKKQIAVLLQIKLLKLTQKLINDESTTQETPSVPVEPEGQTSETDSVSN